MPCTRCDATPTEALGYHRSMQKGLGALLQWGGNEHVGRRVARA